MESSYAVFFGSVRSVALSTPHSVDMFLDFLLVLLQFHLLHLNFIYLYYLGWQVLRSNLFCFKMSLGLNTMYLQIALFSLIRKGIRSIALC
jgi:hypothetical protein